MAGGILQTVMVTSSPLEDSKVSFFTVRRSAVLQIKFVFEFSIVSFSEFTILIASSSYQLKVFYHP